MPPIADLPFPHYDPDTRLMAELAEANDARYKLQAKELLAKSELLVFDVELIIRYRLEGIGCITSISTNSGLSFHETGESRLEKIKSKDEQTLFWEFAYSEARTTLDYREFNPSRNG